MPNDKEPIEYVFYGRKSKEDKRSQLLSIPHQNDWADQECARRGITIPEKYRFTEEKSAKTPYQRGVFDHTIRLIKKGERNGIIVWKLHRLARNPEEAGIIMGMLAREEIKHIITSEREYHPKDNALISYVDFAFADQYSRDLSGTVKMHLHMKADDGHFPGRAPIGYLNTTWKEQGEREIIADPDRFEHMKRALGMLLTGLYTQAKVVDIVINDWKLTSPPTRKRPSMPVSEASLYKAFKNPFYAGLYEYPFGSGNWYVGKHPRMITPEQFDRLRVIIGAKDRPRPKKNNPPFTGLLRCGSCPGMITSENKTKRQLNGNVHYYTYYHCARKKKGERCRERSIEAKELYKQIDSILASIKFSEEMKYWAIEHLHEMRGIDARINENVLKNKQTALLNVTRQLDNLVLKFTSAENLEGKLLTDEDFKALKLRLTKKKVALQEELTNQDNVIEQGNELTERVFQFVRYAQSWLAHGDPEVQKAILASLGSNLTLKDGKVAIYLHKSFQLIADALPAVQKEFVQDRTSKNALDKRRSSPIEKRFPLLCGLVEDVRTSFRDGNNHFSIPLFTEGGSACLKLAA